MAFFKTINTRAEYEELLSSAHPNKLVVVNFHATWCPSCLAISPVYQKLSTQYRHVAFARVDVDANKETTQLAGVTSMPTFKFFKGGNEILEVKGANQGALERHVKQYAGTPEESGYSLLTVQGHSDINEFITLNQIDCLNQQTSHHVRHIFTKDDSYLESDVDEQLLISIPFNQSVKLHSLKITANDIEHAPKTIKLYVNRINFGFDETDSIEETQTLELTEKDYEETSVIPLRFVKFQAVTNLVLFVQDNLGDEDTTIIKNLVFIGSPVETTKIENLKKMDESS
ncbi:13660_t:CDS:2 [Ambispora gerdemannii]|uniref:13660_t:CDS:1 n=1 Tax=Ambispora gerdemannii TaxID=144530 RepID=A0A9N8WDV3_9GLOM|nr:13660_t:CDS:2 [Ambispora gerdemannii]